MIGWGPGQYMPIHDHPDGGCLTNVVKGPGLEENTFWKPPEFHSASYDYENEDEHNVYGDYMVGDATKFYSCCSLPNGEFSANVEACEKKNQTEFTF